MYKPIIPYLAVVIAFFSSATVYSQAGVPAGMKTVLTSPDKNIVLQCYQQPLSDSTKALYYSVSYKGKPVVLESLLDIQLDNHLSEQAMALKVDRHKHWCENLQWLSVDVSAKDTSWRPVCGERQWIRDYYNDAVIHLVKADNPIYKMDIGLRAYNEGIAIRYFFPENEKGTYYRVMSENTEFSLPAGTKAWVAAWAQAPYQLLPLHDWPQESERPLTLQLPGGLYACLAEAQLVDYARTKFKLSNEKPNTIVTSMYTPADLISPVATPWRVLMIAERAGDLIQDNSLLLNLNEPAKIKETDWIKPGKIIRVMTQATGVTKAYIDFAAQHGLQYILFDWKWYGPAFSFNSDATRVVAPLDMPAIIQYGKEKGIGVWLYVNQQALLAQSDSLFAVYRKWGVKGVKFGFVQVGSHRWTTWIERTIQQAAASHIMVNIHDDWRPTGEQRTWPNLMTAEGVRGNEEMPDATHNTVLPFTRYIAGPADYTICYYDKRIKTTHAHQLALAAIYYSPLQTLFWYDQPGAYQGEPEITFFEKIPTVWDETSVLQGEIGQYISTARRSGNDWFVGTITNTEGRSLKLPCRFLTKGKKYIAHIYSDDATATTGTRVKVSSREVDASTVLDMSLLPSGGEAIWITSE